MRHSADEIQRAREWLHAAAHPAIVQDLERIFSATAEEISRRGPACWASGRCCNFERTGHLLYVTGLEAAYAVLRLPSPLSTESVEAARAAGNCPLQSGHLCGVHLIRPLGCRVYFCDRSAQEWQQGLYERQLAELRGLHDRHGVEYRYAEWRNLLDLVASATQGGAGGGSAGGDAGK